MLEIVTLGGSQEAVLKEKTEAFDKVDDTTAALAADMVETMRIGNGVGLAGPQVGLHKRIFVTEAPGDGVRIFINPEIIETSQEQVPYEEGCLSIPGVYADVIRPATVTVQALNEKGKPFTIKAEGFLARVIQHEYDHLKGVLFIDHLPEKKKEKVLKIYEKRMRA